MKRILFIAFCLATIGWQAESEIRAADDRVQFNRDIRPILSANCFACHGFDAKQRKADLRLDTAEGAFAEREGKVFAIKPGDADHSEVWKRIISDDADAVMPPPATKRSLTPAQKQLVRKWIEQGAQYQKHWAFEAPTKATVPEVKNAAWARTPVDRFVLARLEQQGLQPQPEAGKETLIRRVAFALTGLPPTIGEVDAYLNDKAPNAYEKMVDHFLASPRFGEEQARHWLDAARYADTHGLHLDNERQMWAYRDWVVKAFNQNLSFDEFTRWQLAGDLLPNATLDQLVATGFNRCNVSTAEGGSIEPEWVFRNAVDRTSTMIQTWMGLTGGCAVCHDHKYDPLSAKEFYSLYAFFYSAADPGLDGNIRNTNPFQKVPTPEQAAQLQKLEADEAALKQKLDTVAKALVARTRLGGDATENADSVRYVDPAEAKPAAERRAIADDILDDDFPFGSRVTNTSRNAAEWLTDPEFGAKSGHRVLELASSGEYDVTTQLSLIPVIAPQQGQLEFWLRVDPHYSPAAFAVQFDDGKAVRRAAWGDEAQLSGRVQPVDMGQVPAAGEWHRLVVPFEKTGTAAGARLKTLVFLQKGGRVWIDRVRVVGEIEPANDPRSSFLSFWKASKGGNPNGISGDLSAVLVAGPDKAPTPEQRDALLSFFLQHIQRPAESTFADLRAEVARAEIAKTSLDAQIPGTFIFRDLPKPREAFVMLRGQYDKPGEKVEPNVPAVFPALPGKRAAASTPETSRANRLDLANWLLAADHPLTARVQVNRIWQQLFGTGLVKTSDDFGSQGEVPSHPELLDWLSVSFREGVSANEKGVAPSHPWDQKGLLKLLLMSATFRQRSGLEVGQPAAEIAATKTALQRLHALDPENRLYARGPRFRLDAEQLRDNALYVSGLINLQVGGRGVMPYQPPNLWEPVGYQNSNTRFYMQDHGPALYRRSLYCFLKRTAPPPFMSNFDGPNREQFCARRDRSNTPLQALQLMNDVQHFEAARGLAERTIREGGATAEDRITFLYRTVLSRRPDATEIKLLLQALATQQDLFAKDATAARRAVQTGESKPKDVAAPAETAAWTLLANLLLNLDETVTRN